MNILFYQQRYPAFGGIETVTTILAEQFQQHGYGVRIVSFTSVQGTELLDRLKGDTWIQLPDISVLTDANRKALEAVLRTFNPDVIIFQDSYAEIESLLWCSLPKTGKRPKIVVVEHNMPMVHLTPVGGRGSIFAITKRVFFYLFPWPFLMRRFFSLRRRRVDLHKHSDCYLLLSDRYVRDERRISGWSDLGRVAALANPIELENALVEPRKKQIVFAGAMFTRNKGLPQLIGIWSKVWKTFPDWKFIVLGDGPLRTEFEHLASRKRVGNIVFYGNVPNPRHYFRESSIYVMASRREGWPMVLGEAMSCGCVPVVYDSFKAVFDIIDSGINGIIVPSYKTSKYVYGLTSLMIDKGKRERMSLAARAKITSRFSVKKVFGEWEKLLHGLPGVKEIDHA